MRIALFSLCLALSLILSCCSTGKNFKPMDQCWISSKGLSCIDSQGMSFVPVQDQTGKLVCFPSDQFKEFSEECRK